MRSWISKVVVLAAALGMVSTATAAERVGKMRKVSTDSQMDLQAYTSRMTSTLARGATPAMVFIPRSVSKGKITLDYGGKKQVPKAKITGTQGKKVVVKAAMLFPTSSHDLVPPGMKEAVERQDQAKIQSLIKEMWKAIDKRVADGQDHTLWMEVNGSRSRIGSVKTNSDWVVAAEVEIEVPAGSSRLHFDPIAREYGSGGFSEGRQIDFQNL